MVAAALGDMSTTLALLRLPGVDRHMQCARGKDAFEYAIRYGRRFPSGSRGGMRNYNVFGAEFITFYFYSIYLN